MTMIDKQVQGRKRGQNQRSQHLSARRQRSSTRRRLRFEGLDERLPLASDLNDSLGEAESLGSISTSPRSESGLISPDTDVDMYRFSVSAGQTVDFDIDTPLNGPGGLGSLIRLFNSQGQQLAQNNDNTAPGENTIGFDSYLRYTFTTAGTYYLGVSNANNALYSPLTGDGDTAGGTNATGDYTLTVQGLPVDTDDALSEARSMGSVTTTPDTFTDNIVTDIDVDLYRFTVTAGQVVDFDVDTPLNGTGGLGGFLRIFNSAGQEIAFNNDGQAPGETTLGFDPYLRHTFTTAGTYYVGISNLNNTLYNAATGNGDAAGGPHSIGEYTITVQTAAPTPNDPDDTRTEAPTFGSIGSSPDVASDSISPDTDVDVYRFFANAGQVIDFDVDTSLNGPGGLGAFLRIFDANGQEIAFNNDGVAPGENVVGFDPYLRYTFTVAGTYYVGISNANNTLYDIVAGGGDVAGGPNATGTYTLSVQTAPSVPNDTDDETSESQSLGNASTTPVTVSSAIDPDVDVDMYRFTATAGQVIDIDIDTVLNGPGGLGSYVRVFNSQGQQIAANDDGRAPGEGTPGFDSYLRLSITTGGTYYIGVSNANNTGYNATTGAGDTSGGPNGTGSYQLTLQALPTDTDDALSEAPTLGSITTTPDVVNDAISTDIDVDLRRFTVTAGQVVDFDVDTIANGPGGLGGYLRLFNSSGQQLAANDDAAAPGENTIGFDPYLRYTFATAGTYYVGVSNWNNINYNVSTGGNDAAGGTNAIGSYTLTVQTAPTNPNDSDDTLTEARTLGSASATPTTINDSINPAVDVDMYRITVTTGQVVDFDVDTALNGPGGLGAYLRLFNSSGQQIAANDDAAAPGENTVGFDSYLRYTFTAGGTYYLSISNANNVSFDPVTGTGDVPGSENTVGSYQLTMQALPEDPDDTLNDAEPLGLISTTPVTLNDAISPDLDVDLYRFSAAAGQVIDFNVNTPTNAPGSLNSYLRLFNSQGQQLAFSDNSAAPGESTTGLDAYLRFTFPASGTYYIGVSNSTNVQYSVSTGNGDVAGGQNSIGTYQLVIQGLPGPATPVLSFTTNVNSIPEFNGSTTATVTRTNANLAQSLVVNLINGDTSELTVPASVTIPANQTSITFTITAVNDFVVDGTQTVNLTASAAGFDNALATLRVTDSNSFWHNVTRPVDVNNDTNVTAFDALAIINYLNSTGAGPVPTTGSPPPFYDVNSDNFITAFDALAVINYLNENFPTSQSQAGESTAGAAGESTEQASARELTQAEMAAVDAYYSNYGSNYGHTENSRRSTASPGKSR
jgi:hypothetical protein